MSTTAPSTAVILVEPDVNARERLALAGFLAGYSGLTRDAYALDLRQFLAWCTGHGTHLFAARRADIECFGRELESKGRARSTVSRRLCTVAGFYRYAVEEELLDHSPAVHVRRPRVDYESHPTALDRYEVGALLVAAGLGPAAEHALISLLALNGLRVSEATGANIEALGLERGHRTQRRRQGVHEPVTKVDVGGWFRTVLRLKVAGRDRTKLLDGLEWQMGRLNEVLERLGHGVKETPAPPTGVAGTLGWDAAGGIDDDATVVAPRPRKPGGLGPGPAPGLVFGHGRHQRPAP